MSETLTPVRVLRVTDGTIPSHLVRSRDEGSSQPDREVTLGRTSCGQRRSTNDGTKESGSPVRLIFTVYKHTQEDREGIFNFVLSQNFQT